MTKRQPTTTITDNSSHDLSRLTAHPEVLERMGWWLVDHTKSPQDYRKDSTFWTNGRSHLASATPADRSTAIGVMVEMLPVGWWVSRLDENEWGVCRLRRDDDPDDNKNGICVRAIGKSDDLFHALCDAMDAIKEDGDV